MFYKFRKIPVVIGAKRLLEDMDIETLEGTMKGRRGDWLIQGVQGELYPCKDEIFKQTYEPCDDDALRHIFRSENFLTEEEP